MASSTILTEDAHHCIAKYFVSSVNNLAPPHYFFFGKSLEWDDENNPPVATSLCTDEYNLRNNIIYISRLLGSEICFVIPRFDWYAGNVYDKYDPCYSIDTPSYSGAADLYNSNNLVLNSEFNLYKCIDNNHNGVSTVEPTGTETDYLHTRDGYVWRYIMTISDTDRYLFLTDKWVPIRSAFPTSFYQNGLSVRVEEGGQNYTVDNTLISVIGDGVGAQFRALITGGSIVGVDVIDPGQGYSYASIEVSCPDSTRQRGTGAVLTADFPYTDFQTNQANVQLTTVDGDISSIEVVTGGLDYNFETAEAIITGDGTGATASVVITDGIVTAINIENRGSGYTWAEVSIIGTGDGATGRVIVSPSGGHGHDIVEETKSPVVCVRKTVRDVELHGVKGWPDFRQCGILLQPDATPIGTEYKTYFDNNDGTSCVLVSSPDIVASDYTQDQMLVRLGDNTEWYVTAVEDNNIVLKSLQNYIPNPLDQFADVTITTVASTGQTIATPNALKFTAQQITKPDFEKFSGTVLYYDNREVYHEIEDSAILVKTFIHF